MTAPLFDTDNEPALDIAGIDLSLAATGICNPDGRLSTIATQPTKVTITARMTRLAHVTMAISDAILPADVAIIEGPSYGQRHSGSEHLRAGLWWQVVTYLINQGVDVVEIPPAVLKKLATGKGNATKADMRMAYFQRTGIDCRDDNQVDAAFLRQLGLHLYRQPDRLDLPKTHLVALAKIPTPERTPHV